MGNMIPPETVSAVVAGEVVSSTGHVNNPRRQRESGLELLRIIAMLLIVTHHVCYWGGVQGSTALEQVLMKCCGLGGRLGVNIFVLISAYFMVQKKFKLTRILNTILQTSF